MPPCLWLFYTNTRANHAFCGLLPFDTDPCGVARPLEVAPPPLSASRLVAIPSLHGSQQSAGSLVLSFVNEGSLSRRHATAAGTSNRQAQLKKLALGNGKRSLELRCWDVMKKWRASLSKGERGARRSTVRGTVVHAAGLPTNRDLSNGGFEGCRSSNVKLSSLPHAGLEGLPEGFSNRFLVARRKSKFLAAPRKGTTCFGMGHAWPRSVSQIQALRETKCKPGVVQRVSEKHCSSCFELCFLLIVDVAPFGGRRGSFSAIAFAIRAKPQNFHLSRRRRSSKDFLRQLPSGSFPKGG